MQPSEPILRLRDVHVHFPIKGGVFKRTKDHVRAVDGVDLDVYKGEVLGLVGESGCGKTTLGKAILQLVRATGGSVTYHGDAGETELTTLDDAGLFPFRKRLQIVFQDPHSSLNPAYTIFGSLEDPLRHYGVRSRAERRKIVGDLLEAVNMRREAMDRYPHEFSGGQRQRIGIARALSIEPELIVCDEAVSALDVSIQAQVLQLLMDLKREKQLTYVFITHDLSVTEYLCDRIAVMYLGRIVELCDAEELFANTLHPYTEALLSAIPVADLDRKSERIVLEGDVPSPVNPPSGCPFHPRCRYAQDVCRTDVPALRPYRTAAGGEHLAACHLIDQPPAD
ncbi:oligopeptide ABC transporter ATP-binding protein [Oceanicola granulosus HTCC2516]|uniref:Oligopeptide ABC transporter ATP-binding protein n=1 Tax=Oceanicola granulosus (strain ATCC BAA-861 / DSM 15982 / KCTC 12143 / HTCC2516) TaxID=314256 RepID=Q2CJ69_OCEGH|nr:ABC transporter ATP-binding protein [Oceanicola granulosus]EAR52731.1 oligopeptide ABC transporter ATP-binding protein [Oceanicola granulosus HTCC2516]